MEYGGARVGLMGALMHAALVAGGQVSGVIPSALMAKEVAHPGLTELHVVGSMHERKALMAELADGFIALPGGRGTLDEQFEILTWTPQGLHRKPVGLLSVAGYFDGLLAFIGHGIEEGFARREYRGMISVAEAAGELVDKLAAYEAPKVEKWIERDAP